jgi:DNA-directed RNA polymerase subunit M
VKNFILEEGTPKPVIHIDEKSSKSVKQRKAMFSVKFCPKCGSTDVFWAQGMPQFWSLWQCRNCGYRGALILEDGNLAAKLQEDWKKRVTR